MRAKDAVGQYGERVAQRFLEAAGLCILAANWRGHGGELDLIALDGDALVLVEVKTRRGRVCGHPAEAVDSAKLARIGRLGAQWLSASPLSVAAIRIDVVAVIVPKRGAPIVDHLVGVG